MGNNDESKLCRLKLAMNKHGSKVMLAEVESDFADIMVSFLTRPIGAILRSLQHHYRDKPPRIGSLTTLYNSLANLSIDHFVTELAKEMVVNPRSPFEPECRKMKLHIGGDDDKYFTCENWSCPYPRYSNISMYYDVQKCRCGKNLNRAVGFNEEEDSEASGVFMSSSASFVISDDLRLLPNDGVLSVVGTLRRLGIVGIDEFELRDVNIGYNEIMDLLKGSLVSRTPLTDLILGQENVDWKYVQRGARVRDEEEEASLSLSLSLKLDKKMVLKVVLHTKDSGNKLLFAEADEDFVNFLCSLMIIPLGGVEFILCSNTCIASMDNLYRSVVHAMDDKYFVNPDMKTRLKNLKNEDENASRLFYHRDMELGKEWLSSSNTDVDALSTCAIIECPKAKGNGEYVKGPKRYIVTDDLSVAPLSITSSLYVVNQMKIPWSEIKEMEVEVGAEEALSILRASLTSNCAITNGLMGNRKIRRRLTRKRKASRISG